MALVPSLSSINVNGVPVNLGTYNDGSFQVNLDITELFKHYLTRTPIPNYVIDVNANIKDAIGILALPTLVQYLKTNFPNAQYVLNIPYLPHSRQDRQTANNLFTLKHSVLSTIKSCGFNAIETDDVHSNVPESILDNLHNTQQQDFQFVAELFNAENIDLLISPDFGAIKRTEALAEKFNLPYSIATKSRDPNTGRLTFGNLYGTNDLQGKTVLIADDIVEKGGTVLALATKLKNDYQVGKIIVLTTHGIFPEGFEAFTPLIDKIYVIHNWQKPENTPNFVITESYF